MRIEVYDMVLSTSEMSNNEIYCFLVREKVQVGH